MLLTVATKDLSLAFTLFPLSLVLLYRESLTLIVLFWTHIESSFGAIFRLEMFNEMLDMERLLSCLVNSFSVEQKTVICGLTDSFKSRPIVILIKKFTPSHQPLYCLDGSVFRQRFISVPWEAVVLLEASISQTNLDVSEEAIHEQCKVVLATFHLWKFITERGGFHASTSASILSASQRQAHAA